MNSLTLSRRVSCLLCFCAVTLIASRAQSLTTKGIWDPGYPDEAVLVRVTGTNAIVASRWERLKNIDISDPAHPKLIGDAQVTLHSDAAHRISALAVDGQGHAFVAGDHKTSVARFYVYDISQGGNPILIGQRDISAIFPDDNCGMAISSGYAYLAAANGGLMTFDVTTPSSPQLVSTLPISNYARDVRYADRTAYVGAGEGLVIVDVSAPAFPARLGHASDMAITRLALRDHYIYAVGNGAGPMFAIYDVADPFSPKRIFATNTVAAVRGIGVDANNAYLSAGTNGLVIYNISDPTNAVQVASIGTLSWTTDVDLTNHIALSAELDGGLVLYNIDNPLQPNVVGQFPFGFHASPPLSFAIANKYVYLPDTFNGIRILDIHDQTNPVEIGSYPLRPNVGPLITDGTNLFAGNGAGFQVFSLANPTNLSLISSYTFTASPPPFSFDLVSSTLYTDSAGAFNVSDPANPQPISSPYSVAGGVIHVEGTNLYYATPFGVGQIDISNLDAPRLTAAAGPIRPIRDVAVRNGIVYVAHIGNNSIYDARSGTNMSLLTDQTFGGKSVSAEGAILAVAGGGLFLENIIIPEAPVPVATNQFGAVQVSVRDGIVYAIGLTVAGGPMPFGIFQPDLGPTLQSPQMSITYQPPNVVLRWPDSFPGMKLYSTTDLTNTWSLVTSSAPRDANGFAFTNSRPTNPALFYRLSNQ